MLKHNVDILLATYNGENYLRSQLESLLAQTYPYWKVIIHDDNSTDKTVTILQEYTKKYPNKFIFINDSISFGNPSGNFNFLFTQSQADYIMLSDQDDIWLPEKIQKTLDKCQIFETKYPNTPVMVFSDLEVVNENLQVLAPSMWVQQKLNPKISQNLNKLLALNVVSGCTIILNKCSKKYIIPIPSQAITHDHWIAVNIAKYGHITYLNQALIQYRQHANNVLGAHSQGVKYLIFKTKKILKNPKKFIQKYSYFKFPINLKKIFIQKIILNIKRLL